MAEEQNADNVNVLVKFITKQEQYAVPGASVSVQADLNTSGLNKVIKAFIRQGSQDRIDLPSFDFVIKGQFLVGTLKQRLEDCEVSFESLVEIEYLERQPPPTPKDSLHHDDWVAALQCSDKWLLTGCYDNTLHLWDVVGLAAGQGERAHTLTIPAHRAPVKSVTWVHTDSPTKTFISTSIDQTAVVWVWQSETNTVECISECRGHTQSVECVAVDLKQELFATGSWDNMLKIWSVGEKGGQDEEDEEEQKKKRRAAKKPQKKTPIITLAGHSESVGGVVWTGDNEVATASWDHSLRVWDTEIGGVKSQINGNNAFFTVSWSPLSRLLLTGCADRFIRMYDPRITDGSIVQQKFTSHTKWVPSVRWSTTKEHLFVSGGYDKLVKFWDCRSPKAPLYDLCGHQDKILVVDWSNPSYIVSGSSDCTAKVFSSEGKQ
ncbi:ribosome biogenesis protein WDR12 homolog [Homarus americanus]|uniref:Ribosome biogenesis protein WDR12 homolog n=1 Tax=Homarus americanus TaxID=6706 RepID=A0A8J5JQP8_HOMAM|nr:ribosome biogenesis protein WDR12 homolog [Homarus americanus]KAG7159910.1 Ribosome biogenesis protein WDR12-like [Homarus americanus]